MLHVRMGTWKSENSLTFVGGSPTVQPSSFSWASSKESYSKPGYRYLIDTGQSATTTFLASRSDIKVWQPALYRVQRTNRFTGADGGLTYVGHPNYGVNNIAPLDNSFFQSLDNRALGAISKKLINAQRILSGGTVLGELRETIHMIRHPLAGLKRGWHDYLKLLKRRGTRLNHVSQRGRFRSSDGYTRLLQRVVGETWLESAFGWQPLISDLDDAMRAIADLQYRTYPPRRIDSVTIPFSFENDRQELGCFFSTRDGNLTFSQVKYWEGFVKYRACTVLKTDGEPSALESLGLTLDNFVPTLWNLLPFSFLVDYVTNVGDILDAVSMGGVLPAWGVYTRKYTAHVLNNFKYDLVKDPDWVYNSVVSINPNVDISYEYTDRRIANGPYVPELRFTADLSWRQLVNMAALGSVFSSTSEDFIRLARRGR